MSPEKRKQLKAQAHPLKPIVIIGQNGLSDNVLSEIDNALRHHQLVKIKHPALERKQRQELTDSICEAMQAEFVQSIGRILTIYRATQD